MHGLEGILREWCWMVSLSEEFVGWLMGAPYIGGCSLAATIWELQGCKIVSHVLQLLTNFAVTEFLCAFAATNISYGCKRADTMPQFAFAICKFARKEFCRCNCKLDFVAVKTATLFWRLCKSGVAAKKCTPFGAAKVQSVFTITNLFKFKHAFC